MKRACVVLIAFYLHVNFKKAVKKCHRCLAVVFFYWFCISLQCFPMTVRFINRAWETVGVVIYFCGDGLKNWEPQLSVSDSHFLSMAFTHLCTCQCLHLGKDFFQNPIPIHFSVYVWIAEARWECGCDEKKKRKKKKLCVFKEKTRELRWDVDVVH